MTIVFCDGSAINNGKRDKPQGAGIGVFFPDFPEFGLAEPVPRNFNATNQVAELWAISRCIDVALEKGFKELLIKTDSKYSIDSLTVWCKKWVQNGWKNGKKEDVKNKEIIQEILEKMRKISVKFEHVRGHLSEPKNVGSEEWKNFYGNQQADSMANLGSAKAQLI